MPDQQSTLGTRERLLEAAGEVFAEAGFHHATVRDICARAGANIAAVNYHFRDKDGLYEAVLQNAHDAAAAHYPYDAGQTDARGPEEKLRAFVSTFMNRLFNEGRPAWHPKLMAREMVEPTGALDRVVARSIRPHFELLASIVRELLGPAATEDRVARCGASVVGQCLLYYYCRPVLSRLLPGDTYDAERTRARAEHIVAFSLAGIGGIATRGGGA